MRAGEGSPRGLGGRGRREVRRVSTLSPRDDPVASQAIVDDIAQYYGGNIILGACACKLGQWSERR